MKLDIAAIDEAIDLGVPAAEIRLAAAYACPACEATGSISLDPVVGYVASCRHRAGCPTQPNTTGALYWRITEIPS